jgi:outer membrane autotransporter protein
VSIVYGLGTRHPTRPGTQHWRKTIAATALAAGVFGAQSALAQSCSLSCPPVVGTNANTAVSVAFAEFDLGSRFLKLLTDQGGVNWQGRPNEGGGGAPPSATPSYRAWAEGYGVHARTAAQTDFSGDVRRSIGGVAGLGMTLAPGAMIGLSVDQSHTKADVTDLPQRAKFDLTQIGLNGVYESGPWTFAAAGIYGFARVDSTRDTLLGPATAAYNARLFGAVGEATYYIGLGSSRIVPKFGLDWMRTQTDPFSESGGWDPVSVQDQVAARARAYIGAEIGHTWIMDRQMVDLSAYGRVVDIYWRQVPTLVLTSPGFSSQIVQGVTESRLGFDAGAMASYRFARNARLYASYDGRFRDGYQSHGGTLGIEMRW